MAEVDTVLGHKSERNPYDTLPKRLLDFCARTVESTSCIDSTMRENANFDDEPYGFHGEEGNSVFTCVW